METSPPVGFNEVTRHSPRFSAMQRTWCSPVLFSGNPGQKHQTPIGTGLSSLHGTVLLTRQSFVETTVFHINPLRAGRSAFRSGERSFKGSWRARSHRIGLGVESFVPMKSNFPLPPNAINAPHENAFDTSSTTYSYRCHNRSGQPRPQCVKHYWKRGSMFVESTAHSGPRHSIGLITFDGFHQLGRNIGILLDLQGPKIRTEKMIRRSSWWKEPADGCGRDYQVDGHRIGTTGPE